MNVYKKYGAVPKDLYPETESSKNTGELDTQLRRMLHTAVSQMEKSPEHIDEIILQATKAGHRILTIHLGEPPKSFDWEWTDKDGEFHRVGEITPVEFWNRYVATPIWRATSALSTIRATSTPRARRSASSTSTMWPAATRPNTSTCRSSS